MDKSTIFWVIVFLLAALWLAADTIKSMIMAWLAYIGYIAAWVAGVAVAATLLVWLIIQLFYWVIDSPIRIVIAVVVLLAGAGLAFWRWFVWWL